MLFIIGMNRIYIVILILVISITGFFVYNKLAFLNITVKFDDLEPIERQMNVYYKGFKIGKTTKIYPDKNYLNTYLRLKIKPNNINLPSNITAVIKKTAGSRDYVNIIYPDSPNLKRIKNDMTIQGISTRDLKNVLNETIGQDDIGMIVNEASNLLDSANNTVQSLGQTFERINTLIDDINNDIKKSTENIAKTTGSIASISDNLDNALDRETTKKSFKNIQESTENLKNITKNIDSITGQIEQDTMPIVNSVLCETNATMENAQEITSGVKNTLKKHFGMGRLIFGRPMSKDECGCY